MLPTILCLASSRSHAGQIVERLQSANVPTADISILATPEQEADATGSASATGSAGSVEGEKAAAGAVTGGVAGAAVGLETMLTAGLMPLLGLAPIVLAVGAGVGAAIGAAVAGGNAGLSDYGVPESQSDYFHQKLQAGGYVVVVRTENEAELQRARAVFEETGGQDIALHQLTKKLD